MLAIHTDARTKAFRVPPKEAESRGARLLLTHRTRTFGLAHYTSTGT